MNNRSFHTPGQTINSVRVIGPDFARRISVDQFLINNFSVRNSTVDTTLPDDGANERGDTGNRTSIIRARPSIMNSDSNRQSNPSPDEIVIKGRGRRSLPVKWSPIPIESPQKTPLSSLIKKNSPKKGLITLRSSPRKRLQLNDASSSDIVQSRKSLLRCSPLARKNNVADTATRTNTSDMIVDQLSKDQLVEVLNSIVKKHPQIKDEIGSILYNREASVTSTSKIEVKSEEQSL